MTRRGLVRMVAMDYENGRRVAFGREGAPHARLAPGPEDLAAIGASLMDPARRLAALETSLRTSGRALRHPRPDDLGVAL